MIGQANGRFKIGRTVAGADGEHIFQPGIAPALDDLFAVRAKLFVVQVAVRIDQLHEVLTLAPPEKGGRPERAGLTDLGLYFRRAPTGMSSWKPASTGLPPSTLAATIMPCDSMPRSLRGCRFATITTLRPTQLFRLVGHGDSGDDGARLGFADIDFQMQQLVGALHRLGGYHLADAQIDLREIVDRNGASSGGGRCGFRLFAEQERSAGPSLRFRAPAFFRWRLSLRCAGRPPAILPICLAGREFAPHQLVRSHVFERLRGMPSCVQIFTVDAGITG